MPISLPMANRSSNCKSVHHLSKLFIYILNRDYSKVMILKRKLIVNTILIMRKIVRVPSNEIFSKWNRLTSACCKFNNMYLLFARRSLRVSVANHNGLVTAREQNRRNLIRKKDYTVRWNVVRFHAFHDDERRRVTIESRLFFYFLDCQSPREKLQ